jgi:hypothetical protein
VQVLVNHLGYSSGSPKKAVLQGKTGDKPLGFSLVNRGGAEIYRGGLQSRGEAANWKTGCYWSADFSSVNGEGFYRVVVETEGGPVSSDVFEIRDSLITMRMISAVGYYFKAQRSSGEWLLCDRNLPFQGDRQGRVDAHGGWYDATGDYGIHLSHLSHSTVHNPQQIGFSVYTFFKVYELLESSGNYEYSMVKRRMLDEGGQGADFLMRMRAPGGGFFRSINRMTALTPVLDHRRIGFEYRRSSSQFSEKASTADEEIIGDENYETSLRSGGGLAVAALAAAGRHFYPGRDYDGGEYILAAKRAWDHLEAENEKYTNDGEWNLVDEYCALTALVELWRSTGEYGYLEKCRNMYDRICRRGEESGGGIRLMVRPGEPYYHASDEGMPAAAVLQYADIESDGERRAGAIEFCEKIMRRLIQLTDSAANPFGYPRLEYRAGDGTIKQQFFFPHESSAAPWWQGENARLASIAAAARMLAARTADRSLAARLEVLAQDPLDWIMGLNPFDSCMIEGYGKNNIQYFFNNRYDFLNCPGGIVNGITSDLEDEEGIGFISEPGGPIQDNWRWAEQWIPHASWYLYAMALKGE